MRSASQTSCASVIHAPAKTLIAVLSEVLRAVDGRVVLLRALTKVFDQERDDIDLLLTESQRKQLLRAMYAQCLWGGLHCRIRQSCPAKIQLILWTEDCSAKLMVDLWTSFDQLPQQRRKCIPADRLLNTLTDTNESERHGNVPEWQDIPALCRLPADIDFCLLVQHLGAKRKNLTTPVCRERILRACEQLKSWPQGSHLQRRPDALLSALRDVATQLPRAIVVTSKIIKLTEDYLLQRLASARNNRGLPLLERKRRRGLTTELRKAILNHRPIVELIGSDGAGKSSAVAALASKLPHASVAVAKKLYRRSLIYQLASGVTRRLGGPDREKFDDRFAHAISLRAAVALWLRMCLPFSPWSRNHHSPSDLNEPFPGELQSDGPILILDRSCIGFLILDRKSDNPRLARCASWMESLCPPTSSVLLTLSYAALSQRKREMSSVGHETYQRLLFDQALRQQPADLTLLSGLSTADESATFLLAILQPVTPRTQESLDATESRKAVA
jgi:hypothetical protein